MQYAFGDYTLDTEHYELRRAGSLVRLEPRVFNLLAYLVQHPGRTVTKEELREQLWPNQPFMSDDPLTNCVAQARRAIGDSGQAQRCIKTVHSRGYRFIAPVDIRQRAATETRSPTAAETPRPAERHGLDQADAVVPLTPVPPEPPSAPPPASVPAYAPHAAGHDLPAAERRQLTVLVCELVDSTALAGRLDPEAYWEVVRAYQDACATVIQRFDGHIAQVLGEGLVVYFGYPQAHEDDAQRAVRAGLALVAALEPLKSRLARDTGVRLAVRVGIHTGLVVVGEMGSGGRHERLALGDTPHLAAQLPGIADRDTVVVSAATLRLVEGYVRYKDLGPQFLKGVNAPVAVYCVLGEGVAQSRLEVAATYGLTPLVGREVEVALLRERWAQVMDGLGQVILLQGEGGIGKSRLIQVLKEHLAEVPHTELECRGSPYHQHSTLYPVIELWQRAFQLAPGEAPAEHVRKLKTVLARSRLPVDQTVALLAVLLSLPLPADHAVPLALTPQQQKQQTLEVLLALLLELAAQHPVLLIVEDLHWIDPATLEWLSLLLDQVPTARLGLLMTARPDFQVPWSARAHLTQLTLGRLSRPQVQQMVERVAGGKTLPAEVVQQIVTKADGVPLFVEELTKMVLESGVVTERDGQYALTGPLSALAIPATLHDSLMARLDRLGPAKQVAQLGATLGREFAYEVLQAVAPLGEATLQQGLAQLVEAELLYQRGLPPRAQYTFKHALIQEAAYQSLLTSTRRQYHQQIVEVLAARFPDTVQTQPELLAYHAVQAQAWERAVRYLRAAGDRALAYGAYTSAAAHYEALIDAVERQGPTGDRTAQLDAYLELWACRIEAGQFRGLRQLASTTESLALALKDGARLAKLRLAQAQGLYYFPRQPAALHEAIRTAQEAVALADPQDRRTRSYGGFIAGAVRLNLGQFREAVREFDRAEAVLQAGEPAGLEHTLLLPIHVSIGAFRAQTLAMLGEFDRAVASATAGCQLAERCGSHPIQALAQALLGRVLLTRGAVTAAAPVLEAGLAIAHEQRATMFAIHNAYLLAWATELLGDRARSTALLDTAIQLETSLRHELSRLTYYGADRARLLLAHGRLAEATTQVERGLALATAHGARGYEPELWYLQAHVRLRSNPPDPEGAWNAAQGALTQATALDAMPLVARCHCTIGQLLARSGDHASAQQHLTRASELFKRLGMIPWQTETDLR